MVQFFARSVNKTKNYYYIQQFTITPKQMTLNDTLVLCSSKVKKILQNTNKLHKEKMSNQKNRFRSVTN